MNSNHPTAADWAQSTANDAKTKAEANERQIKRLEDWCANLEHRLSKLEHQGARIR